MIVQFLARNPLFAASHPRLTAQAVRAMQEYHRLHPRCAITDALTDPRTGRRAEVQAGGLGDKSAGGAKLMNYAYDTTYVHVEPMGWVCPKCGKVLAPWVPECNHVEPKPAEPFVYPNQPLQPPQTGDPLPTPSVTICEA